MRVKNRSRLVLVALLAIVAALVATPLSKLGAQGQSKALTLALPSNLKNVIDAKILKDFESANPGVTVSVVDAPSVPYAADGIDAHFTALQQFANSADVLYVTASEVSPQATRSGYYLDLTPLINSDTSLKTDDFYPALWQSF